MIKIPENAQAVFPQLAESIEHIESTEATSLTRHLDYLDGWRGLAILFLLAGHFFPVPGINLGRFGVNLFFVLSGLLMARLLFLREIPIGLFYKRRISRIFPGLYFFLAFVICVMLITGAAVNWHESAAAALLVNNYFQGEVGHGVMPFGHIWSLSVEENAYILLSLIALAARRGWCKPCWMLGAFIGVSIGLATIYWRIFPADKLEFGLWYRTEIAAYGIFVSAFFLLVLRNRKMPDFPFLTYPVLGAFALILHWWSVPLPFSMIFGVGILGLLVNILHKAPPLIKAILSFLPLRKFGVWSFSLYVWQQPFYLAHYHRNLTNWLALTLACLAGIASYYLIENPVRGYLNACWTKQISVSSGNFDREASRLK